MARLRGQFGGVVASARAACGSIAEPALARTVYFGCEPGAAGSDAIGRDFARAVSRAAPGQLLLYQPARSGVDTFVGKVVTLASFDDPLLVARLSRTHVIVALHRLSVGITVGLCPSVPLPPLVDLNAQVPWEDFGAPLLPLDPFLHAQGLDGAVGSAEACFGSPIATRMRSVPRSVAISACAARLLGLRARDAEALRASSCAA